MEMIGYCGALVTLAVFTKEDIKEKKISVKRCMMFGVIACLFSMYKESFSWHVIAGSLFPGAGMMMLSWITKESIGLGDGAVIMILGLWTGMYFTLTVLCIGILAAGVYGLTCLAKKRKAPFPFLPFLLLGMEVALLGV